MKVVGSIIAQAEQFIGFVVRVKKVITNFIFPTKNCYRFHRHSEIYRQRGMTLVPVLITVLIFSMLITQIIIPLQNRNLREASVQGAVNAAEQLVQGALAFRADPDNGDTWPQYIDQLPDSDGNYDNRYDLVPKYLPVFTNRNPWGGDWQLISGTSGGNLSSTGLMLVTETNSHRNATALVQKIGPSSAICDFIYNNPDPNSNTSFYPSCDESPSAGTAVKIAVVAPTPSFVESLTVGHLVAGTISEDSQILQYSSVQNISSNSQNLGGSSEQFKENIQALDIDLRQILGLKPVSYNYKPAFHSFAKPTGGSRQVGLIAEDVQVVIPELVIYQNDQPVNVDYEKLSVLVLKLAQQLKEDLDRLQADNHQLQKQLEALEATL